MKRSHCQSRVFACSQVEGYKMESCHCSNLEVLHEPPTEYRKYLPIDKSMSATLFSKFMPLNIPFSAFLVAVPTRPRIHVRYWTTPRHTWSSAVESGFLTQSLPLWRKISHAWFLSIPKSPNILPGVIGSSSNSTLIQFLNAISASLWPSWPCDANTIPGQSNNLIFLSSVICCATLVKPGVDPTPHTLDRANELMTDDLPTLG